MRNVARVVLALIVLAAAFVVLPRSASRLVVQDAFAQIVPTPSIPDIIDNSPKPSPTDDADGDGDGGGDDDDGGSGGDDDGGGGDGPIKIDKGDGDKNDDGKGGPGRDPKKKGKRKGKGSTSDSAFSGTFTPSGSFSTTKLVSAAARLRALGASKDEVIGKIYPPFIIAGDAAWTNTWGAPRYGPGPIVRTHEGQDVFCNYGDPVLAPEAGTTSYSDGGLGGITARVHTSSNSYWYLTHLSETNADEYPSGSSVEAGDVIGFCGNSGNAATTPPHVHFGWYVNGTARNPHGSLVRWLHEAERRVLGTVSKANRKQVKNIDRLTAERLFGDAFAPDLSELTVSGESLWASGSSPATGAFALAEAALQAALAQGTFASELGDGPLVTGEGAANQVEIPAANALSELLQGGSGAASGSEANAAD